MKKLLTLLAVTSMVALASCGGSENKTESAAKDSVAAAEAATKAENMATTSSTDTTTKVSADTTKH